MLVIDQLSLDFKCRGGPRPGAGRPKGKHAQVLHRVRQAIPKNCPVHVTIRIKRGLPRLRTNRFLRGFRSTVAACCVRRGFRVVHYSVQTNHIHLLIEAQGKHALANGMKSLGARIARLINRTYNRKGAVLEGRYHHRVLRSPREVRRALAYVLLNARKHWAQRHHSPPPVKMDEASSGAWFEGWRDASVDPPLWQREVASPRTWLMNVGWRRHGRISLAEVPSAVY